MADKGNRRAPTKPNGVGGDRSGNRKRKSVSFLDVFNANFQVQENESRDAEVFNNGEIKIEAPTGKIISLMVKGSDTIGSIKLKIQTAESIPFDQQELIFNGLVLEDIKILADLLIKDSVLKLVCKSSTLKNGKINIVETATGNIIPLKFKCSDTIGSIKLNIQKKEGIPFDQQELILNGMVLEDSMTLSNLLVKDSTLKLVRKSSVYINISIKNLEGSIICSCDVKPTDTIASLKENIKIMEGISVDEQVLIFNKMVLGDSDTLFDFHINSKSTITLIRKSRGFMKIFIKPLTGETITQEYGGGGGGDGGGGGGGGLFFNCS
ncbi:hypothetical protein E3N88_14561 [Mikania micrantha]|uniref:Ubiquitin-like domain-containing protein n=1 Tax=Mikania micrantha TaxID=192012 RepID=A0A5N6P3H3_9ASTR|nr:hypothetical protein E3N88_14561 [Mikania micrantha]